MDPDTLNLIFQSFLLGSRLERLTGGLPTPSDDHFIALIALLKKIEAGDETTIDSAADGLPPNTAAARSREEATRENRQIERQLATIVLDGFPPQARDLV